MKDNSNKIIILRLPALAVRNLICEATNIRKRLEMNYTQNKSAQSIWDASIMYWKQIAETMEDQLQEQLSENNMEVSR